MTGLFSFHTWLINTVLPAIFFFIQILNSYDFKFILEIEYLGKYFFRFKILEMCEEVIKIQ